MVIGADLGQKRVGADGLGRRFHQGGDDNAVMVGAGRFNNHFLEKRLIEIGQLQQLDVCDKAEEALKNRGEAGHQDSGDETAEKAHGQTEDQIVEQMAGQ